MERKSSCKACRGAIALLALVCGAAVNASAADKIKGSANANDGAAAGPSSAL